MEEHQPPAHKVTFFWAAAWLIAVFVIGILAAVAFYQFEVVDVDTQNRLLGIIIIGEVLLYFIVLLVPGERVVPPGRTVLAVFGAMVARGAMALAASEIVILRYGAEMGLAEMWLKFQGVFWPAAVMHILLLGVYLWLIRSALETPRSGSAPEQRGRGITDHRDEYRVPSTPDDEEARRRQEELLSALMEEPDEPVEWPAEVIAEAQKQRVNEPSEQEEQPQAETEEIEARSTDTMPPVPALLADETEGEKPCEESAPAEDQPAEQAETRADTGSKDEETPESEQVAEDLVPPAAQEETEPTEPPVQARAPETSAQREKQEAESEKQPVQQAPMTDDLTSEQASMIEEAVTDLPDIPVSIAMSPSDRPYALLGMVSAQSDTAEVSRSLDVLYATHLVVGAAVKAGRPTSLSILAREGSLILGASEKGGAGVGLYTRGEEKIGRLNLLARKVADAASDMPLDRPYDPGLSPATECTFDAERTDVLQKASGMDRMRTYSCEEYEIAICGPVPHPEDLASAVAALAMAATDAMKMLPATNPTRVLAEYTSGGVVIAVCGDLPTLVVTITGASGTMGGAYVKARNVCQAIEEG